MDNVPHRFIKDRSFRVGVAGRGNHLTKGVEPQSDGSMFHENHTIYEEQSSTLTLAVFSRNPDEICDDVHTGKRQFDYPPFFRETLIYGLLADDMEELWSMVHFHEPDGN